MSETTDPLSRAVDAVEDTIDVIEDDIEAVREASAKSNWFKIEHLFFVLVGAFLAIRDTDVLLSESA